MLPMPNAQQWNAEALTNVNATPWDVHARDAQSLEVVFKEDVPAAEAARADEPAIRRQM